MRKYFIQFFILITLFEVSIKNSIANYMEALEAYKNLYWVKSMEICMQINKDNRCDNLLGVIFLKGEGVKKDYQKAFDYFYRSSQNGNKYAYKNLAWMYLKGLGVEKNLKEASRLLKISENEAELKKKMINKAIVDTEIVVQREFNEDNKTVAIFRKYFSEYQKIKFLISFYNLDLNKINVKMEEIHNKISNLENNINLEYKLIQDLKKEIIEEQKITLKLYELSLINDSFDLENEIKKIYTKIYELDLEGK